MYLLLTYFSHSSKHLLDQGSICSMIGYEPLGVEAEIILSQLLLLVQTVHYVQTDTIKSPLTADATMNLEVNRWLLQAIARVVEVERSRPS